MTTYTRVGVVLTGLVALLSITSPSHLTGQEPGTRPIFLALPQAFPDIDARVVLMREPGRDIVVLDASDASPETLDVALLLLRRVGRERSAPTERGQMIPITGFVPRAELTHQRREHLSTALAELRERPLANVGNLGRGHWMRYRQR
jgi:hypothetical protein